MRHLCFVNVKDSSTDQPNRKAIGRWILLMSQTTPTMMLTAMREMNTRNLSYIAIGFIMFCLAEVSFL